METCPKTGKPCSNPKIIHVTDIDSEHNTDKSFDLCQLCGIESQESQPKEQLHPIVKNLFDLLSIILAHKQQLQDISGVVVNVKNKTQDKLPCPSCGMTLYEIGKTSRMGCSYCYEYYKIELLPLLIHVHKSNEHVGKRPKFKAVILPLEEQIRLLEMQMNQAADQEQYEKAKEFKDKLSVLKAKSPQSEQSLS